MNGRLSRRVLIFAACSLLGGCAGAPSLRSIVYEEFGANAVVMMPHTTAPTEGTKNYTANKFRYVPGAFASPDVIEKERNDAKGQAAVWKVSNAPFCWPDGLNLKNTFVKERELPVVRDYQLDTAFPFNPFVWLNRAQVRETFADLRDDEFGSLKRVTITLSKIREYEVDEEQLEKSMASIRARKYCGYGLQRFGPNAVQVRRVIVANIDVVKQSASGFRLTAGRLEARHLRRADFHQTGNDLLIVFLPR